jgi:hypothetical protein
MENETTRSRLEPGHPYIYERVGHQVYARKTGTTDRVLISEDFSLDRRVRELALAQEWTPILMAAETNTALQEALNQVKIVYELTKHE